MRSECLKSIRDGIDNWIFGSFAISPEGLALYRISFAAYTLLLAVPNFVWIAENPDIFYDPPPSVAVIFGGFPGYLTLQLLSSFICALFIMLLFGYRTRVVSILLTATLIVANSFRYSFGKIDHNILPVITPLVMSFSGWGARFSLDSSRGRKGYVRADVCRDWPMAFMALFLAFGFFSAGLPKALKWIDFDFATHGVRRWLTTAFFIDDRQALLVPLFVSITNPYFWEVLDYAAVAFELGFLFALPFPKAFRMYVGFAVLFHFANHLMLNIPFSGHMVVYLLFFSWEPILSYLRREKFLDKIHNLFRLRYLFIFAAVYFPLYYLTQRVVSGTSATTASPLQLVAPVVFGLEYTDLRGLVVNSFAAAVVLCVFFSKTRRLLLGHRAGRIKL